MIEMVQAVDQPNAFWMKANVAAALEKEFTR